MTWVLSYLITIVLASFYQQNLETDLSLIDLFIGISLDCCVLRVKKFTSLGRCRVEEDGKDNRYTGALL